MHAGVVTVIGVPTDRIEIRCVFAQAHLVEALIVNTIAHSAQPRVFSQVHEGARVLAVAFVALVKCSGHSFSALCGLTLLIFLSCLPVSFLVAPEGFTVPVRRLLTFEALFVIPQPPNHARLDEGRSYPRHMRCTSSQALFQMLP